ncbi:MAG TPA: hemerythrin domain-containing protein [Anaeromyxobacter sp.]|nr:hemerythrin domain-containing protein [Anaeromyxobacter sp.]
MDAIEALMNEHRLIEAVLDGLVSFTDEVRRKGTTEKEELGRFVDFIRGFADACHHGKEEGVLFQAMVEHGFPRNGGPIAVMLMEHDEGRALVASLKAYADQGGAWTDADRQKISETAFGYSDLLRHHIQKEDGVLYPMAEQHLPPEALERVSEDCERFEAEQTGSGEHERFHALAEALVARHASAAHPHSGPGSHRTGGCCG